jgi:hypothetical protein
MVGLGGIGDKFNAGTLVCSFHMGMGNILKSPLLFTYKRRPPLLTENNTSRSKSYTTRASF